MSVRAILSTLEYKIMADMKNEVYARYTARALQILTENVANTLGGKTLSISYDDLINPKPADNRSAEEIINSIKNKIEKINS